MPTLLGQKLPEYKGYDSKLDPTIDVLFMTASFRYGHSAINPLILRLDESGKQHPNGHLVLRDVFFNPLPVYQAGIEPILRGMLFQPDSEGKPICLSLKIFLVLFQKSLILQLIR